MNSLKTLATATCRAMRSPLSKPLSTQAAPAVNKNVMQHITDEQIATRSEDGRDQLFSRKNPQGIRVGNIVLVESQNGPNETTTSSFMGVCVAIRRRGIDTSFTLRNLVMNVGVEQRYSLYSPLIRSIKRLQQSNEIKPRRAKLFYLRNQSGKIYQPLQALWRQEQQQQAKKK